MPRYRLLDVDGEEVGEINLADPPKTGDDIFADVGRRLRVVMVIPTTDPTRPFNGMLMVEPAQP